MRKTAFDKSAYRPFSYASYDCINCLPLFQPLHHSCDQMDQWNHCPSLLLVCSLFFLGDSQRVPHNKGCSFRQLDLSGTHLHRRNTNREPGQSVSLKHTAGRNKELEAETLARGAQTKLHALSISGIEINLLRSSLTIQLFVQAPDQHPLLSSTNCHDLLHHQQLQ
jgi:hypothetical protein